MPPEAPFIKIYGDEVLMPSNWECSREGELQFLDPVLALVAGVFWRFRKHSTKASLLSERKEHVKAIVSVIVYTLTDNTLKNRCEHKVAN